MTHRTRALSILTLTLLACARVASAEPKSLVAVMELGKAQSALPEGALVTLDESLRARASDVLRPLGYGVLPKDLTAQVLRDNGVDASRECDSSCALENGRELKARFVIEGVVSNIEGVNVAFVRVLDTKTGEVLGTIKLRGSSATELETDLDARITDLFRKAGLVGAAR